MIKYYEKNGEQVSGEAIGGRLITTMTVGGALVSNPLITDIESDGWVEYIPSTPGDVQISAADWTALITAVNQLTGSTLVYSDTAQDVTDEITALRNGVTFANVAKWWSLPTLLCERKTIITAVSDSSVETVGNYAFQNATALTSVNLPNCTNVGIYAFYGCSGLTSVNLPNCTSIGQFAFQDATALTSVNLPNCTNVGLYAFSYGSSLIIFKGDSITNIGTQTFRYSPNVSWFYLPSLTGADDWNFDNKTKLRRFDIKTTNWGSSGTFNFPVLYCLVFHMTITSSLNLTTGSTNWNPTEAVDANSTSLVPQQEWDIDENGDPIDCSQFTSNRDKFLYCFKHLFMPAFGTVSSATLTLKSTVYDVVMADNEVSTYFNTHGWAVARVA